MPEQAPDETLNGANPAPANPKTGGATNAPEPAAPAQPQGQAPEQEGAYGTGEGTSPVSLEQMGGGYIDTYALADQYASAIAELSKAEQHRAMTALRNENPQLHGLVRRALPAYLANVSKS